MFQLSSNSTLFFRIFLPIFWLTFFGAFMLVSIFVLDEPFVMGTRIANFRIGIVLFWLTGLVFFYFTSFKINRVDADEHFIYVSNYAKNFRYPYHNIEKITLSDYGILSMGKIELKEAGNFGKNIRFIRSHKGFKQFLEKFPNYEILVEKVA